VAVKDFKYIIFPSPESDDDDATVMHTAHITYNTAFGIYIAASSHVQILDKTTGENATIMYNRIGICM